MADAPEFNAYPEIENHYNRNGKAIIEEHGTAGTWVATEKIHGTNFCFIYEAQSAEVSYARRGGVLSKNESFFNFQSTIGNKYSEKLPKVFELVKAVVPDVIRIQVFGEFYGGVYQNVKSPAGTKPIQTSILYCPGLEFEAFDIFYDTASAVGKVLNYKEAVRIFEQAQVPHAEIVKEGTLNEILNSLDPETYESTIYKKHGLQRVEGNFAEGFVVKPVDAIFGEEGRVCLKWKNSKHLESGAAPTVPKAAKETTKKTDTALTSEDETVVAKVLSYVTQARYDNLVSKLTDEEKNEKKIVGLMMADVWKDFGKAEEKETLNHANKLKAKIMPLIRNATVELIPH